MRADTARPARKQSEHPRGDEMEAWTGITVGVVINVWVVDIF